MRLGLTLRDNFPLFPRIYFLGIISFPISIQSRKESLTCPVCKFMNRQILTRFKGLCSQRDTPIQYIRVLMGGAYDVGFGGTLSFSLSPQGWTLSRHQEGGGASVHAHKAFFFFLNFSLMNWISLSACRLNRSNLSCNIGEVLREMSARFLCERGGVKRVCSPI